jgi:hypothetical protein
MTEFERKIFYAEEKILQAESAHDIKDLLKQDTPPEDLTFSNILAHKITNQIFNQIPLEEINNIDIFFSNEMSKIAHKTDDYLTSNILGVASQIREPGIFVRDSIYKSSRAFIEQQPELVCDKIFEKILPGIKQDIKQRHQQEIENKQNVILQCNSPEELKNLLNSDDPERPVYQEALSELLIQRMQKINPVENVETHKVLVEDLKNRPDTVDLIFNKILPEIKKDKDINLDPQIEIKQAQEKVLQANSSQEIKDLLNKDDPKNPIYQEALSSLLIQRMQRTSPKESIEDHKALLEDLKNRPGMVDLIYNKILPEIKNDRNLDLDRKIETAKKAGYVQGVCECVAAIGDDHTLGKKLLTEMNVNRDMAKKYANPETYKTLEKGIFAQKQEQTLEQTQAFKR